MSNRSPYTLTEDMKRRRGVEDHLDSCKCDKCRYIRDFGYEPAPTDRSETVPGFWLEESDITAMTRMTTYIDWPGGFNRQTTFSKSEPLARLFLIKKMDSYWV